MITRRGLFGVLAGAVAAPIVVRAGLLMPVKALVPPVDILALLEARMRHVRLILAQSISDSLYADGTGGPGGLVALVNEHRETLTDMGLINRVSYEGRTVNMGFTIKPGRAT